MDWQSIISGILAGGLAGQIITLFGTDKLTHRRDYRKWLVAERMKLFSELLTIVTLTPKTDEERSDWTYKIRDCSQRIHILFETGTAPKSLADAMEASFQFARELKHTGKSDEWSSAQRDNVRSLRQRMAEHLNA